MVGKMDNHKIKCLIKAFLLTHPGKHSSKEISEWITFNDFGIRGGVTTQEVGVIIKESTRMGGNKNFLDCVCQVNEFKNSGKRMYYIGDE